MFFTNTNDNYFIEANNEKGMYSSIYQSYYHLLKWKHLHTIQCSSFVITLFKNADKIANDLNNINNSKVLDERLDQEYAKAVRETYKENRNNKDVRNLKIDIDPHRPDEFTIEFLTNKDMIIEF